MVGRIGTKARWLASLGLLTAVGGAPALASNWLTFSDQSAARISASPSLGLSDPEEKDYAWGDVDQDGDIDLVCVRKLEFTTPTGMRNVLFMNENGVLTDRTNQYAVAANDGGQGFLDITNDRDVVLFDVDNDGWLDIITAVTISVGKSKTIGHPRIYMNLGDDANGNWLGFFYDEPRIPSMLTKAGVAGHNPRFCSLDAGDVTGDGYADLYFGDYDSSGAGGSQEPSNQDYDNKLLINRGAVQPGFFLDETETRLTDAMAVSAFGAASVITDINNDGHNDIVKQTGLNTPTHIAITYNKYLTGGGVFQQHQVVSNNTPYFVTAADLNNDGWKDLIITDDGTDHYTLSGGVPNPTTGVITWGPKTNFPSQTFDFGSQSVVLDFNNDGWLDVFIADVDVDIGSGSCTRGSDILRNNKNAPNVTFSWDIANIPEAKLDGIHNAAIFDLNNDGWLDFVFGRCSTTDVFMNIPPVSLTFSYPSGTPTLATPGEDVSFDVNLAAVGGSLVNGSAKVFYSVNGGSFTSVNLTSLGGTLYEATIPAQECLDQVSWYVSAQIGATTFTDPTTAPSSSFGFDVADGVEAIFNDEIEGDVSGWQVVNEGNLTSGAWEAVDPVGTISGQNLAAPEDDHTPGAGIKAFVTQNGVPGGALGAADVDGGTTRLISPVQNLQGNDAEVSYAYWFFTQSGVADVLNVAVSNDNGNSWVSVVNHGPTLSSWQIASFTVSDYVTPTAQVRVRFTTSDVENQSVTEAGIDDVSFAALACEDDTPLTIVSSSLPNDAIDARQPSNIDGSGVTGWANIELTFDGDALDVTAADFSLSQEGGSGTVPTVATVILTDVDSVNVVFSAPINPSAWTTLTYIPSGGSVRLGYLPADVNSDGVSAVADVLVLIDSLNGIVSLPIWSTDIDRSGLAGTPDVLREIDLLNGAGAYDPYVGASLPD